MHHPLYPKPITDDCPYCGSSNTSNDLDEFYPSTNSCCVTVECKDCDKTHHLNYKLDSVTLNDDDGNQHEYIAGQEIPDMSQDGGPDQDKTLVAAQVLGDGIFIMAAGYGDGASAYGYGCPVIIEMYQGQLRVVNWTDIREEECQIVELGAAKEVHREIDDSVQHVVQIKTPTGEVIEQYEFSDVKDVVEYQQKTTMPTEHVMEVVDQ